MKLPNAVVGTAYVYEGETYLATPSTFHDCDGCAFDLPHARSCDHTPSGCGAEQFVWMTPANAITRRLTT